MSAVDIIFCAHGRPEFTTEALLAALRNTNPGLVRRFIIYTDGDHDANMTLTPPIERLNQDGEWTRGGVPAGKIRVKLERERLGGPVACMSHYLATTAAGPAEYFAKIDNDLVVCPEWLEACLSAMDRFPEVDLLGIEPWAPELDFLRAAQASNIPGFHGVREFKHVGGIGLFRRSAFAGRPLPEPRERAAGGTKISFGWTEWQWQNLDVTKAFLNPPLPVFLLDHLPVEPWMSLSKRYVAEGVQRQPWAQYPAELSNLWEWWTTR